MSLATQGTAHLYGIVGGVGVIANASVLSFSLSKSNANTAQTKNELGNEIERRYDDLHEEGTITLRPRAGFTKLVPGAGYTYDSVAFEVVSEGDEQAHDGHETLTYTIKKSEYITTA